MIDGMVGFIFGFAVGVLLFYNLGYSDALADTRSQAIERGYGLYCPVNASFAWVGECDDKP